MSTPYKLEGRYINLERSVQRRAFMEQQLQRLNLPWITRCAGVDGSTLELPDNRRHDLSAGGYGCYLSHKQLVEAGGDDTFTLILEDDVELSVHLATTVHLGQLASLAEHDLVFLEAGTYFQSFSDLHRRVRNMQEGEPLACNAWELPAGYRIRGVSLLDATPIYDSGGTAYLVTPKGRAKLRRIFSEVEARQHIPVDSLYKEYLANGTLRGALMVPFLAAPDMQLNLASTIGYATGDASRLRWAQLVATYRRLLFAGAPCIAPEWLQALGVDTRGISTVTELRKAVLLALCSMEIDRDLLGL